VALRQATEPALTPLVVSGTQPPPASPTPQTLGPPPPQNSGGVHVPQGTVPPHPSGANPQFWPAGHICFTQFGCPHWFATPPPPQVCGGVHIPQGTLPPQPLEAMPQFWPVGQPCGVHPPVQ
jgi:hypothetical protein